METYRDALSSRLKVERLKAGLLQREVYEKTGIKADSLSNYEHGKQEPSIGSLIALAELYGCTAGYLINDYDEKVKDLLLSYDAIKFLTSDRKVEAEDGTEFLMDRPMRNLDFISFFIENCASLLDKINEEVEFRRSAIRDYREYTSYELVKKAYWIAKNKTSVSSPNISEYFDESIEDKLLKETKNCYKALFFQSLEEGKLNEEDVLEGRMLTTCIRRIHLESESETRVLAIALEFERMINSYINQMLPTR